MDESNKKFIELSDFSKIFYSLKNGQKKIFQNQSIRINYGINYGLLGKNGAGKTTLMQLLSGAETLSSGKRLFNGKVSWPIGVYTGLDPRLTGSENIYFIASLLGLKNKKRVHDHVVEMSELSADIHRQLNTFSAGMRARLGFYLSLCVDFDFYLIDELTAVGDSDFQKRSSEYIQEVIKNKSLILCSHQKNKIRRHCEQSYIIQEGSILGPFDTEKAIYIYENKKL